MQLSPGGAKLGNQKENAKTSFSMGREKTKDGDSRTLFSSSHPLAEGAKNALMTMDPRMRRRHHECGEMTEGIYHQRSYKTKEFLLED